MSANGLSEKNAGSEWSFSWPNKYKGMFEDEQGEEGTKGLRNLGKPSNLSEEKS